MNNQSEWKIVIKNRKNKKKNPNQKNYNNNWESVNKNNYPEKNQEINTGDKIMLPYKYVLWCHDIFNKDWSIKGYLKLCSISTISDFWKVFNNLDKIGYKNNNFFLMKEDTEPVWEHVNNRNGGICSFRTEIDQSLEIYEDLCINMVLGNLINDMNDINGISISPKNNWAIIKIWNKNKNNDISFLLNNEIKNKYNNYS